MLAEGEILAVLCHANDRDRWWIRYPDCMAHWIAVSEQPMRQCLVQDRDCGRIASLAWPKFASGQQRNAHRMEIAGTDQIEPEHYPSALATVVDTNARAFHRVAV